jgi:hypothetical protein
LRLAERTRRRHAAHHETNGAAPRRAQDSSLVDRLKEAPERMATYVKHLAKSISNQVLAYMKSYFPRAPVDVVVSGLAANYSDEQYKALLEEMVPIAE